MTLDGKTIGRTPVTVTLPDREQIQVRFELGGYLPLTQDLVGATRSRQWASVSL